MVSPHAEHGGRRSAGRPGGSGLHRSHPGDGAALGVVRTRPRLPAGPRPSSLVFVVGGDVADAACSPDGVVVLADGGEFGAQRLRVADGQQVRMLSFRCPLKLSIQA